MGRLSKRDALLLEALFCALPLVYYLLRLPSMPETVPVHWNAAGEATRYAARFSFDTILSCFIGYMGLLLSLIHISLAPKIPYSFTNGHAIASKSLTLVASMTYVFNIVKNI